ncbi:hypothetical protein [Phyllobacterium sp. K27]
MAQSVARVGRLKSGDGSGTFDGMETRVALLEKSFEKTDAKLDLLIREVSSLKSDVSYLKGKVDILPTTLHLLGFVLAVLTLAGFAKYFTP